MMVKLLTYHSRRIRCQHIKTTKRGIVIRGLCAILLILGIHVYLATHPAPEDYDDYAHFDHQNATFPYLVTPKRYRPNELHVYTPIAAVKFGNLKAPGEMGEAVTFPPTEVDQINKHFPEHQFNIMASDRIALNRSLPDFRPAKCHGVRLPSALPDTSIIIIFHNEAWSTLMRSLWSVCSRSPRELVREIILVDDASEKEYLGVRLERVVKLLSIPVRILRQMPRQGLIKARLLGANAARGQTLTFLDSHVECLHGWLEPLLARVARNRHSVPSPTIDIIDQKHFQVRKMSANQWGGMSAKFRFIWTALPDRISGRNRIDALHQPTMAGGLFTIDRAFFFEIGSYDEGMQIWGAENIEMSLRVWMCGGMLEFVPCSRVAHVFRSKSPHVFPSGSGHTVSNNTVRMVTVWAAEYANIFFKMDEDARKVRNTFGDVSRRVALRERLQCKNMDWYLENIYPEHVFNGYLFIGAIRNDQIGKCITLNPLKSAVLQQCHNLGGKQYWIMSAQGLIMNGDSCIAAAEDRSNNQTISVDDCESNVPAQLWRYDTNTEMIVLRSGGQCLGIPESGSLVPRTLKCNDSRGQKWQFVEMSNDRL